MLKPTPEHTYTEELVSRLKRAQFFEQEYPFGNGDLVIGILQKELAQPKQNTNDESKD